ncbi:HmuY family protein [Polaribacter sp. Hel_I_88]|uniref:HmuY family protein n=1 Tax=Polaribacter sp. Hel_I_88 TaxID=1250006 RepID=UPI00047AB28C|nr:HmuY family protein [Polaribacter sp. Hel_I_88]
MRTFKTLTLVAIAILGFTSCSNDEDTTPLLAVESEQVANLHAPQTGGQGQPIGGEFTKFDFSTGITTTSDTEWDIAFRGTTIIVNGGTSQGTNDEPVRNGEAAAYIATNTFEGLTTVDVNLLVQDSETSLAIPTGSDNGWYNYNPATFTITPLAGKILVFRTRDNRYAKVEILSYYQDAPSNPDPFTDEGRYYTFNYVYQPNENVTTF